MAYAASSCRFLSTSVRSIPAFSTRARVPQRFAPPKPQFSWIKSPALFSTQSTLRTARDAESEAVDHASTTRDTGPSHETDVSFSTGPEPDAEPALGDSQREPRSSTEQDKSVDHMLYELTGRRPGSSKPSKAPVRSQEDEDAYHQKEDIIAALVTGKIEVDEANKRLAQLEHKNQAPKTSKTPTKPTTPKIPKPVKDKGATSRGPATTRAGDKPWWMIQKEALKKKFEGASWQPPKRVSPDAVLGIRDLHKKDPEAFNIKVLAARFEISREAVRRILKSNFQPSTEEMEDKRKRWEKRGEKAWTHMSDTGVRPPKKWREMGVSRGPAPWKRRGRQPDEAKYAWERQPSERPNRNSLVGRIE